MKDVQKGTVSLSELLGQLTKQELDSCRRVLQVPGASQLKKSDLAQCLGAYMLDHLEEHLARLDHDRCGLLQKVAQAPGLAVPIEEIDPDHYGEPAYYQCYGFLFLRADGVVIMPHEIREGLLRVDGQRLQAILDRNTEWIRLTQGLLYYYGTLEVPELIEQVGQHTGRAFDDIDFLDVIDDLEPYDGCICGTSGGYSHFMVEDPQKLAREHQSRSGLEYYPFNKAQLLRAAVEDFVDRHAGHRQFVSFLRDNWVMDKEEAEEISDDLVDCIQQGGSPITLVTRLQEELEVEDEDLLSRLLDALVEMMGKTRIWALKGHTPEEVFEGKREQTKPQSETKPMTEDLHVNRVQAPLGRQPSGEVYDFQTKKKVGRNDPCPCGSGKKFKKCCGS